MKLYKYYLVTIAAILGGCGGGNEGGGEPDVPTTRNIVSASDTLNVFRLGDDGVIDLSAVTASSDGGVVSLKSLRVLSGSSACNDYSMQSNGFTVSAKEQSACLFEYTVGNSDGHLATALSRVVFTPSPSKKLQLEPRQLRLDVYGSDEVDVEEFGLQLSENIYISGSGTASVDVNNSKIIYRAQETGVSRIFYEMTDETGLVFMGTVDIAVSDDLGKIESEDFSYPEKPAQVLPGQKIILDVKDYVYVSGEQSLQLHDVHSFNNVAKIAFPDDLKNTKIEFEAPLPDDYYISYTVTNHTGGFSTSVIKVTVSNYFDNIYLDSEELLFSAPLSFKQAKALMLASTSFADSSIGAAGGKFESALFDYTVAKSLCAAKGGRIPSLDELQALQRSAKALNYWPTENSYYSVDSAGQSKFYTVDLSDPFKAATEAFINEYRYVTCVVDPAAGDYEYELFFPSSIPINGFYKPVKVEYWLRNGDGTRIPFKGNFNITKGESESKFTIYGDGLLNYYSGTKAGRFLFRFRPIQSPYGASPVDNLIIKRYIDIVDQGSRGFFGTATGTAGALFSSKTYNLSNVTTLFSRCGAIVDALGISSTNYAGGTGGTVTNIPISDIQKMEVTTGTFSGAFVIGRLEITTSNNVKHTCGKLDAGFVIKNKSELLFSPQEKIKGFTIFYDQYIRGLSVTTDK